MKKSKKLLLGALGAAVLIILLTMSSFKPLSAKVKGNGHIITENYTLNEFTELDVDGWHVITLIPDEYSQAIISMDENLFPYLDVTVIKNKLNITSQSNMCIDPSQIIQTSIRYTQALRQLNLKGHIELQAEQLDTNRLTLNIGGKSHSYIQGNIQYLEANIGGDANLDIEVIATDTISLNIGGNGQVTLRGKVDNLLINTGGAANIIGEQLIAKNVVINGAGLSQITLHITEKLNVAVMGKSVIQYYGNPKTVTNESFGKVVLKKMD